MSSMRKSDTSFGGDLLAASFGHCLISVTLAASVDGKERSVKATNVALKMNCIELDNKEVSVPNGKEELSTVISELLYSRLNKVGRGGRRHSLRRFFVPEPKETSPQIKDEPKHRRTMWFTAA